MNRYNKLSQYWKNVFGTRIQKIPLDAGFDCPNRDGGISGSGCIFCNTRGSGTGLGCSGMSLQDQYLYWKSRLEIKFKGCRFAAYLQSFSNTYGPLSKLEHTLEQLLDLPELAALCVGTRPDCLDPDKAGKLASFPVRETWLELGLQSSDEGTLCLINRGHTADDFARACRLASAHGLRVCAHVIAGLPGEDLKNFLRTIDFINRLPVHGIKFHNLYVCRHTTLAVWWSQGRYCPLSLREYSCWIAAAIGCLRPDITVHRLTGDPSGDELLAPLWARGKNTVISTIHEILETRDLGQGMNYQKTKSRENLSLAHQTSSGI